MKGATSACMGFRDAISLTTPGFIFVSTPPGYNVAHLVTGGSFTHSCLVGEYLAAVEEDEANKCTLCIYHLQSSILMQKKLLSSRVLRIDGNNEHIFISMDRCISMLSVEDLTQEAVISRDSSRGTFSLCDTMVAWTDDGQNGIVFVADIPSLTVRHIVKCHSGPIKVMSLSEDGQYLSTASEKGTILRCFNTRTGKQISENRRGFTKGSIVCIDTSNKCIMACSKKSIHFFDETGIHITYALSDPALLCKIYFPKLVVLSSQGVLYSFRVSTTENKLTPLSAKKILTGSPQVSQKHFRISL